MVFDGVKGKALNLANEMEEWGNVRQASVNLLQSGGKPEDIKRKEDAKKIILGTPFMFDAHFRSRIDEVTPELKARGAYVGGIEIECHQGTNPLSVIECARAIKKAADELQAVSVLPAASLPPSTAVKIQSMVIEARLTCYPREGAVIESGDFSTVLFGEGAMTRLEGPQGTITFPFLSPYRVRKQVDGRVIIVDRFALPPDSELLGKRIDTLQMFDRLIIHFRMYPDAITWDRATYLEVSVKVNGEDYWYVQGPVPADTKLTNATPFMIPVKALVRQ